MRTIELFENSISNDRKQRYISYYFANIIGYRNEVFFNQIDFLPGSCVVILKDDIHRLDKNIGSGVLRQRPWSIFVFNFIQEEKYIDIFGKNSSHKNIVNAFKTEDFNELILEEENKVYKGKYPDYIYRSKDINHFIQHFIFDNICKKNKALLVNAYIYSVFCIIGQEYAIQRNNYNTYYFNTNYKFVLNKYPNIIQQSVNINKTSYVVENVDVELENIINSNQDLLDLIDAYTGKLTLTNVTNYNYNSILKDVEEGVKFIIVEGMARTGKTVIAMRLLHKYNNSKLLLMNYHFYCALRNAFKSQDIEFPINRIYHHDMRKNSDGGWSRGQIGNREFLIVDEAQRLGIIPAFQGDYRSFPEFDEISTIINYSNLKHTIFLGDNLQKLNHKYDRGLEKIVSKLKESNKPYRKYYFDHSIGIPVNVLDCIKYLIIPNYESSSCTLSEYEINIFDSETEFVNKYKNDNTYKKHMSTIYVKQNEFYNLNDFESYQPWFMGNFSYFLDKDIKEKYLLTPYQLISRELDSIYIYLPNSVKADNEGLYFHNKSYNEFLMNQIYVLMTRAKLSVNIYCQDRSTYEYLLSRYEQLKANTELYALDEIHLLDDSEIDLARDLEIEINEKGITRLIHFTCEENIESIMKHGILSVDELISRGILYDFNDKLRLDKCTNAISLSVQNPNHYLLNKFKRQYPNKKYKIIIINPAILYDLLENEKLVKRFYCNYNAAATNTAKSPDNLDIMYQDNYLHFSWYSGNSWSENRADKVPYEPTTVQAEILFFGNIPTKYILDIKDAE